MKEINQIKQLKKEKASSETEMINSVELIIKKKEDFYMENDNEQVNENTVDVTNYSTEQNMENTMDSELLYDMIEGLLFDYTMNLLDPTKVVTGKMLNRITGNLISNEAFNSYIQIPIEPSTDYILQRDNPAYLNVSYGFYDDNGIYISGSNVSGNGKDYCVIATPDNAYLLTFSYAVSNGTAGDIFEWKNIMLSEDDRKADYIPYKVLKEEYIYSINVELEKLKEGMNSIYTESHDTFSAFRKFGVRIKKIMR